MTIASEEPHVCPFCSLLCEDLHLAAGESPAHPPPGFCARADGQFRAAFRPPAQPRVRGRETTLGEALAEAARLLRASRHPLFTGLAVDAETMRVLLPLAERLGATVDHWHGETASIDRLARQREGIVVTTLAEARNRADLLLLIGTLGSDPAPRLWQRVLRPATGPFEERRQRRRILHLGEAAELPEGVEGIPCPSGELHRFAALLRARIEGHRTAGRAGAGLDAGAIERLAGMLRSADYAVLIWAAGELPPATAELLVGSLAGILRALNRQTRAAGLPLSGPEHAGTADRVALWQTGVPLPVCFADGAPESEPRRLSARRLLAEGRSDLLLWVAPLSTSPPPAAPMPRILLHHPAIRPQAEVTIPIGLPGIDHPGTLFRLDGVVALPVRALRATSLPSAAEVLEGLLGATES